MNDGRVIPREPDVPGPEPRQERSGGDGRVARTSAFVRDSAALSGVPNAVRRDHRKLMQELHGVAIEPGLSDWMTLARHDRAVADGTLAFPAPSMDAGPGLDYLGRPTGRRRGGRSR